MSSFLEVFQYWFKEQIGHYQIKKKSSYQERNSFGKGKKSPRLNKSIPLPIDEYDQNHINIHVKTNKTSNEDTVVIIKRSKKCFVYHSDTYYRDKGSKRNNFTNQEVDKPHGQDLKKFYKNRYYLFSKFDRGVKIDDESWYSITPETIAKHVANRVAEVYGDQNANVMDGFCGVGGNLIQFARKSRFSVGNDQNIQIINKDFLSLKVEDISYPEDSQSKMHVVFMSPPWGGTGYNLLEDYKLEYLYPDFTSIIKKALEFSKNIILFLPKNTSIDELIEHLLPFASEFNDDPETRKNELVLEIEQVMYGESCKGIHIYTGDLPKIDHREIVEYFYQNYCHQYQQSDETFLKVILGNIFQLCGYNHFVNYFKNEENNAISLQKVIKKLQKKFSDEEWNFIKKYHKRSRTNSKRSSTLSHVSMEEEKMSEASSAKSGRNSQKSSQSKKKSKIDKLAQKYSQMYDIDEDKEIDQELPQHIKKVVHFEDIQGHIELKDLTQNDFEDLIAAKNQDKRFYGWLHFGPIDDYHEKTADPVNDIEYFRLLYDNEFFTSNDVMMENVEELHKISYQ